MGTLLVYAAIALGVLGIAVGYLCGVSALLMVLYQSLAPAEWVHPNYLQWLGLTVVVSAVAGFFRR